MYTVISKKTQVDASTLDAAMAYAKTLNEFVTIKGPEFEVCGIFGVDEVTDPNYNGWISRKHNI
jgi:hypothetical protein|tara:strand:+ start:1001 stop:1192 length:192 start_codon:yes stop_codon:yes gene_type:complete